MTGDHARAAQLLASLAVLATRPDRYRQEGADEAVGAGQMDLALKLSRSVPAAKLPSDARLLLAAEEIRRNHPDRALPWLGAADRIGDLSFLAPLITAWAAADRGDVNRALSTINSVPQNSLLAPLTAEERAFILLKFKRSAEAEPLARAAVGRAGAREQRLRLAFADAFLAAGDKARALMIVEGMGAGEAAARQRIGAGRTSGQAVDNLPKAFGEVLTAFAADLARLQRSAPPVGLVQVAHYVNPQNSATTALLGCFWPGRIGPMRGWPCCGRSRRTMR